MKLANRTVLITGASGGIGGAIARQLVTRGASLILVNRQREKLEALAGELRAHLWKAIIEELRLVHAHHFDIVGQ